MNQLRECFYCEGTAERYGAKLHHGVQCINCGIQISMTGDCAKEEIVHVWNKIPRARHPQQDVQGLVKAAHAVISAIDKNHDHQNQGDNPYSIMAGNSYKYEVPWKEMTGLIAALKSYQEGRG